MQKYLKQVFTLLELLLVIAILSSLTSIVIFNLRPSEILNNLSETSSKRSSKTLEEALKTYALDHSGQLPSSILSYSGTYPAYICKYGEVCPDGINLDILIQEGYLSEIPIDSDKSTQTTSGYKIAIDPATQDIAIAETTAGLDIEVPNPKYGWEFEEGSGTTAYDTFGNQNGTLYNGPTFNNNGVHGKALYFDGTNDYVRINPIDLTTYNALTIEMWFYPEESNRYENIFIQHGSPNWVHNLEFYNSTLDTYLNGAYMGAGNHFEDRWNQVVMTYNKQVQNVYHNGQLKASRAFTQNLYTSNFGLFIGAYGQYGRFFKGKIDSIKIYNAALSPAQVVYTYSQGAPHLHYALDEGTGQTAANTGGINALGLDPNYTAIDGILGTDSNANTTDPTWQTANNCKLGNSCLLFDGVDDYINIPDNGLLEISPEITVNFWTKFNVLPTNPTKLVGKWNETGNQRAYVVGTKTDGTGTYFEGVVSQAGSASPVCTARSNYVTAGNWYMVTMVYNKSACRVYVNGTEYTAGNQNSTIDINKNSTAKLIAGGSGGESYAAQNNYLNGYLDDIRIYTYSLKIGDVVELYNGTLN